MDVVCISQKSQAEGMCYEQAVLSSSLLGFPPFPIMKFFRKVLYKPE